MGATKGQEGNYRGQQLSSRVAASYFGEGTGLPGRRIFGIWSFLLASGTATHLRLMQSSTYFKLGTQGLSAIQGVPPQAVHELW